MAQTLIFATNNAHKVRELNDVLRGATIDNFDIQTMGSIGHTTDLPETHETILENAIEKAEYLYQEYSIDCFSEDTGLEIDFLEGKPGVHTAHYSGSRDAVQNMNLVLKQLGDTAKRSARFRTVICLMYQGQQYIFEGICEGRIALQMSGTEGFGYDPIFIPEGYDRTFAELDASIKSVISHRAKATHKLLAFLKEQ